MQSVTNDVYACTRFTRLVPLPIKEAKTVAEAVINEWILKLGHISMIVSDNEHEFFNNFLHEILDLMQIKHQTVMPYAPQGNSTAKQMDRSMAEYLRMYTNTSGNDWERFLPDLEFSLNVKVHSSKGHSAWYLTYR